MPDFEALIRHQQSRNLKSSSGLKIVEKNSVPTLEKKENTSLSKVFIISAFGGTLGSILGTSLIIYLWSMNILDFSSLSFFQNLL